MSSRHSRAPACQQPQHSVRGDVHNCKFCCRTYWDLSRTPPQQCENICPFLTVTREIRKRCHTYILRKSPFIDSHHTIGLVYFPTAIPPELAFTGIHCFKILFPAIDPYVSRLVVLQSPTKYSAHLLMSLKSVLPPPIRLLISSPSYSVAEALQQHLLSSVYTFLLLCT